MLRFLLAVLAVSFLACEPDECEEYDDCDDCEDELGPVVGAIVAAAEAGMIVETREAEDGLLEITGVDGIDVVAPYELLPSNFDISPLVPIGVIMSALAECPALGLPSDPYWWFCMEDNANGRVIAREEAEPDIDSFSVYDEYPSVAYPEPMTSRVFFSQKPEHFPKHWGGPYQAMRGIVQSWGGAWGNARVDWCNHPVHGERCVQE
jgi:hypothetical protein